MSRRWFSEEQRLAESDAAEGRQKDYITDDVDQNKDREKPPEQYLWRDEFASSEETEVPLGEREKGQRHVGNYNERLHHLLATIFRIGSGQTIPRESEFRSAIFI